MWCSPPSIWYGAVAEPHRNPLGKCARGGGDLRLALVYSAFAIHFLEDFFAPGHIRAPRSSLHDAAAMNIHDRFNRRGQCFILEKEHLEEIGPPFLSPTEFADRSPGWLLQRWRTMRGSVPGV